MLGPLGEHTSVCGKEATRIGTSHARKTNTVITGVRLLSRMISARLWGGKRAGDQIQLHGQ